MDLNYNAKVIKCKRLYNQESLGKYFRKLINVFCMQMLINKMCKLNEYFIGIVKRELKEI